MINFVGENDYAHYAIYYHKCSLTPQNPAQSPLTVELSLYCKQLLLSAFTTTPIPILFGGSFVVSPLGNPDFANAVFTYLASHPWLQVLSAWDLSTLDTSQYQARVGSLSNTPDLSSQAEAIYTMLLSSPSNAITDLAWQLYDDLEQPAAGNLGKLQMNYLGQIGVLAAAATWANASTPQDACNRDLDYDGSSECILSNEQFFAIIDPEGGYMPFLFARDDQGIHQLIGPSWEFVIGLGDPSTWDLGLGVRADPDQILGAFQDDFSAWNTYSTELTQNTLVLNAANGSVQKTFIVYPDRIQVSINTSAPFANPMLIPLAVDPWFRYTPGWGDLYRGVATSNSYIWGLQSIKMVKIQSTQSISAYAFSDTRSVITLPEDPNFDYSLGHYLPFPMAVVRLSPSEAYRVEITVDP